MTISAQQGTTAPQDWEERPWPAWRTWTIRVWYGLLSGWAVLMAHGVLSLVLGRAGAGEHFVYGTVTVFKLLACGGVFGLCWTGGRSVLSFHFLVVGSVAWSASELLWAQQPPGSTPVASAIATGVLWFLPLIVLRPNRRELLRLRLQPSAALLPLTLVLAVPAVLEAVRLGALATTGPTYGLYADGCSLAVVLAAQAVFSALRPRDGRWLPRIVGAAAGFVGLLAVVWPDDVASPGRAWGGGLIAWSALYLAVAELENRWHAVARA
jgi:hypothetical protein